LTCLNLDLSRLWVLVSKRELAGCIPVIGTTKSLQALTSPQFSYGAERNPSRILISFNAISRELQWRMNDSSSAWSCP
jgi:hypothetical protein